MGEPTADGGPMDASTPDQGEPEVDMFVPETCPEEGAMRAASCGNCGMTQERCEGGTWVAGACLAEGECAPGALEERSFGMCGTEARLCTAECTWLDWSEASEEMGECTPGETQTAQGTCGAGEAQPMECTDGCTWQPTGPCMSVCGTLRTSPADSEEVCVPAGQFIRGDDQTPETPRATIFVSSFAIDRYPVTNRRFAPCWTSGACTGLYEDPERFTDPALQDQFVLGVRWETAQQFCQWDGARRLPTEAEWEKAMRGPAPRDTVFAWGDAQDCSIYPLGAGCPGELGEDEAGQRPFHSLPAIVSPFGAEDMIGQNGEWVSDLWDPDYQTTPDSRRDDPQGPSGPGVLHVIKSNWRTSWSDLRISSRRNGGGGTYWSPTFRCARTGF